MIKSIFIRAVFIAALIIAAPLSPLSPWAMADSARGLFENGDYAGAISQASGEQTAAGYALAAEAQSTQIMLNLTPNAVRGARRAKALALKALAIEPQNPEALIQYAVALGLEARALSPMKVVMSGVAKKSKMANELAYAAAPQDARIMALQGAWHLGAVQKGGAKRAMKMLGANMEEGLAWYEAAIIRAPDDVLVTSNYALSLLAVDPVKYRDECEALLKRLARLTPKTAAGTAMQTRMAVFLPILDDVKAVKRAAEDLGA
jgi:hypothetical protein